MKLTEHTFSDHQGNYVVEIGEMFCNGRYCMEGYAGGGAFCKAWKAFDVASGERVCIKIIGNRKPHSEQSRREIKILKFLNEQAPEVGIGVHLSEAIMASGSGVYERKADAARETVEAVKG